MLNAEDALHGLQMFTQLTLLKQHHIFSKHQDIMPQIEFVTLPQGCQ